MFSGQTDWQTRIDEVGECSGPAEAGKRPVLAASKAREVLASASSVAARAVVKEE